MLAGDFGISPSELSDMVNYFTLPELNLLQIEDGFLRCKQLDKRSKCVFEKRDNTLEIIRNKVSAPETIVNSPETTVSASETPQSKVKESKGKNSIIKLRV